MEYFASELGTLYWRIVALTGMGTLLIWRQSPTSARRASGLSFQWAIVRFGAYADIRNIPYHSINTWQIIEAWLKGNVPTDASDGRLEHTFIMNLIEAFVKIYEVIVNSFVKVIARKEILQVVFS